MGIAVLIVTKRYLGALIVAILAVAILAFEMFDVTNVVADMNDSDVGIASVGWGLYLATAGAVFAAITSAQLRKATARAKATTALPESPN